VNVDIKLLVISVTSVDILRSTSGKAG